LNRIVLLYGICDAKTKIATHGLQLVTPVTKFLSNQERDVYFPQQEQHWDSQTCELLAMLTERRMEKWNTALILHVD
jgi:hypothetical protein